MSTYFVTPLNENYQQQWEQIYGRTHLPIKYPTPHLACTQRWGDTPVYYLDVTAVPPALLDRLAVFEARRTGLSYSEARLSVRREWLIRAEGCRVEREISATGPTSQPAFPFLQKVPLAIPSRTRIPQPAF